MEKKKVRLFFNSAPGESTAGLYTGHLVQNRLVLTLTFFPTPESGGWNVFCIYAVYDHVVGYISSYQSMC